MLRRLSHLASLRTPAAGESAKRLRSEMTRQEARIWYYLRAKRVRGWKFRRQVPLDKYVVDFLCERARLIVEIDGGQHYERRRADEARTQKLMAMGYRVMRFWNNDVTENLGSVLQAIVDALDGSAVPPPQPSPKGEGDLRPAPPRGEA